MTIEHTAAGIGASIAAATAIIQQTAPGVPTLSASLLVPVVSALIGGLMSYAVLRTTVTRMERDVRDMRKDMSELYALLREALTKLAHLEGRINRTP